MSDRWRRAQEYELRFWKRYAPRLPEHGGPPPRILAHLPVQQMDGNSVLEVGCGPMGGIYYAPGRLRVGLDPLAASYVRDIDFSRGGVQLVTGVGERLPFPDASFDIVICANVIDHVDRPEETLRELGRVVRRDGTIFLSLHVIPPWLAALRPILNRVDTGHPYHMTRSDTFRLLAGCQLRPASSRVEPMDLGWREVKSALANLAMRLLVVTSGAPAATPEASPAPTGGSAGP